jgi:DNA-binding beta-propeller fold protein YncE
MRARFSVSMLAFLPLIAAFSCRAQQHSPQNPALLQVADLPLPGPAVRFDYQSLDPQNGRLYIAHMNADQLVVFDVDKQQIIGNLDGFRRVHGVIAVPQINRVFASATGDHKLAIVDSTSLKTLATAGPINYPDGLAYSPDTNRVFVSDEHGNADAVVDVATGKLIKTIPLHGPAGNTVYDAASQSILVAVHEANEFDTVDPHAMTIVARTPLPGIGNPHGVALDSPDRLAFIAGEGNATLAVVDLKTSKVLSTHQVGEDPDVLAFDPGLKRLYVSAESGTVTVFQLNGTALIQLAQFNMPHAHTVAVDPRTHLVYFPLENIGGKPILRIMKPANTQ